MTTLSIGSITVAHQVLNIGSKAQLLDIHHRLKVIEQLHVKGDL